MTKLISIVADKSKIFNYIIDLLIYQVIPAFVLFALSSFPLSSSVIVA